MRNMRQVIKTNHNFMTGEHYEQRVLKPVQASYNRVTIQLCDAVSGQIVEEAVTENAITPLLESMAYGNIAQKLNYSNNLNGACYFPNFSAIALSDSGISELEDLYFIHGNIIGICGREDASGTGTNTIKGIYNAAESYSKFEGNGYRHIHLVYDWPTSSGNGTIQNIYWFQPRDSSQKSLFNASPINSNNAASLSGIEFDRAGNAYKIVSGKYYKILNFLKYINGIENIKIATQESFHTKHEVNGNYYTFSYKTANSNTDTFTFTLTVNKHDTTGNILDTWTEDLISNVPQLVELKKNGRLRGSCRLEARNYCDFDGWVGFYMRYESSANDFPRRDSEGNLIQNNSNLSDVYTMYNVLTKQWLRVPNPWDVWCTYEHYTNTSVLKKLDDKHFCVDSYYIKVDTETSTVTGEQYSPPIDFDYNARHVNKLHATLPIVGCNNRDAAFAILPICAQTRLAAPITKTTLNTMKIQYDFFFKVPLPYLPPEHVWDLYK